MATPRGAEHRDLEKRFSDMQRAIDDLSSVVLRQRKLEVTSGDLDVSGGGSVVVSGGGSIVVSDSGDLQIKDSTGHVIWSALSSLSTSSAGQWSGGGYSFPGTLSTDYGALNFTVPTGYSRALVSMFASARDTGSGGYLVQRPRIITPVGTFTGEQVDTWVNSFGTVGSSLSRIITGLSGGDVLQLRCQAADTGSIDAGSGTVVLSGSVVFQRA